MDIGATELQSGVFVVDTLVDEFDTTVTTIQAVITLYCLVMAMFMPRSASILS
mgnify:CR=1 FL=1